MYAKNIKPSAKRNDLIALSNLRGKWAAHETRDEKLPAKWGGFFILFTEGLTNNKIERVNIMSSRFKCLIFPSNILQFVLLYFFFRFSPVRKLIVLPGIVYSSSSTERRILTQERVAIRSRVRIRSARDTNDILCSLYFESLSSRCRFACGRFIFPH